MPKANSRRIETRPTEHSATSSNAWDLAGGLRFLVYGDSGTGKTTLASTFPGPTLWLLCSGGNQPGELHSIDTEENRRKITPVVIHSTDQYLDELRARTGQVTTVLDHSSGMLNLLTKEMLGMDSIPAVKKWGMAQQRDWGNINEKMIELLRALLNLRGNVVVIGQERIFKGGEDQRGAGDVIKPAVGVALTPGVTVWLRPAVDYEVQAFKRPRMDRQVVDFAGVKSEVEVRGKGVEYCIRTEPHDVYMTKFRLPRGRALPDVIVDPSYDKIVRVIQGTI